VKVIKVVPVLNKVLCHENVLGAVYVYQQAFLTSALDGGGLVVCFTHRPLHPREKWRRYPLVGPSASLDVVVKSYSGIVEMQLP